MGACCCKGSDKTGEQRDEQPTEDAPDRINYEEQPSDGPIELSAVQVESAAENYRNRLGLGPYGDTYRGSFDGRPVVVKTVQSRSQKEEDVRRDVEIMGGFSHDHVVRLLAFCCEGEAEAGRGRALILEFAEKGNLAELLRGKEGETRPAVPLTWQQRLQILLGAARGLAYLHSRNVEYDGVQYAVVHKRVTSSNVLVFEGFVGKISESSLRPKDQESFQPKTFSDTTYTARESMNGDFTDKSDVYSFGIVLLEALSGQKTTLPLPGKTRQVSIREWAEFLFKNQRSREAVDPTISENELHDEVLTSYWKITRDCLRVTDRTRPSMQQVVERLENL